MAVKAKAKKARREKDILKAYEDMDKRLRNKISRRLHQDALQEASLEYISRYDTFENKDVLLRYAIAEGIRKTLAFDKGIKLNWTYEEKVDPELRILRECDLAREDEDGEALDVELDYVDGEALTEALWILNRIAENPEIREIVNKRLNGEALTSTERVKLMRFRRKLEV